LCPPVGHGLFLSGVYRVLLRFAIILIKQYMYRVSQK